MALRIARDLVGELIRINSILPSVFDSPPIRDALDNLDRARWALS